ncbi:MAG: hypothetical protein WD314_14835 [Trueperaceae bacterium]
MKKFKNAVVLVLLAGLLTSCGALIGQLIGAQPAENALGLDAVEVAAAKQSEEPTFESAGLTTQAVREYFVGSLADTFEDVDWEAIQAESPVALPAPKSYSEVIGISGSATVAATGSSSDLPAVLTLVAFWAEIAVTDADGTPTFEKLFGKEEGVSVQFDKGECSETAGSVSCAYTTDAAASELSSLIDLSVGGSDFSTLWNDILTNDDPADQSDVADQNAISGTVFLYVEAAAPTPADTSITVSLDTSNGTINFAN